MPTSTHRLLNSLLLRNPSPRLRLLSSFLLLRLLRLLHQDCSAPPSRLRLLKKTSGNDRLDPRLSMSSETSVLLPLRLYRLDREGMCRCEGGDRLSEATVSSNRLGLVRCFDVCWILMLMVTRIPTWAWPVPWTSWTSRFPAQPGFQCCYGCCLPRPRQQPRNSDDGRNAAGSASADDADAGNDANDGSDEPGCECLVAIMSIC